MLSQTTSSVWSGVRETDFEVIAKDVLGRVGRFGTKSGDVETPHLLPVISPRRQVIPPKEMKESFGCDAIITNAYLLKKEPPELTSNVHSFLDFSGVIATDSGAYQILSHGGIDAEPAEIVQFQERVGADIAVILDVPTGDDASREHAEYTVGETLRRADELDKLKTRKDVLWVGPIQGGLHLDLLEESAKAMSRREFDIYAIGSPTRIMEQYLFDKLVDMILTVKQNLPPNKPVHLFGAGHPAMFSLAVALGCDLFDSASYALYARKGRYMTELGTTKLDEMEYFPCSCPQCASHTPRDISSRNNGTREAFLARHNLHACMTEMKRVKEAIVEGRLWELVEARARAHPRLLTGLLHVKPYAKFLERHSPSTKKRGILIYGASSLARPEVERHRLHLRENYRPPQGKNVLVLVPRPGEKPSHTNRAMIEFIERLQVSPAHICLYGYPFGVVPIEIDDVFPLSQFEASPPDEESLQFAGNCLREYLKTHAYKRVVALDPDTETSNVLLQGCKLQCKKSKIPLRTIRVPDQWLEKKQIHTKLIRFIGGTGRRARRLRGMQIHSKNL